MADALKAKGIVPNRQEGFRRYLVPGQPGYVPSAGVTAIEAIQHIKRAGGMPVIAHPGIVSEHWNFPAWAEAGLEGVEVFYPAHTFTMKQDLLAITGIPPARLMCCIAAFWLLPGPITTARAPVALPPPVCKFRNRITTNCSADYLTVKLL